MTALFGIPNDRATLVSPCEPWNYVSKQPTFGNKADWLVWRGRPDTEHLLFTPAEGLNPALRCDAKTNPIRRLHALVADYDSLITPAMDEAVLQNAPSDLRPNWISHTFSGGRRLVYLFEEPLVFDPVIAKKFLSVALVQLRLRKLLPGLDTDRAWPNITQIYDVGSAWTRISDKPLPSSVLHLWLTEAAKNANWKTDDALIPIEAVAAEVERQYPASWPGEFALGARGNVFWDGGQNPTSTIVAENGMICFSREKIFYSWVEVLGAAFVRKFTADKIGGAVAGTYFDGRCYYQKIDNVWMTVGKDDFVKRLKVKHGLDASRGKNETASETERAEVFVQEHRRVSGVIPCLFDSRDVIERSGKKILNISCLRALEPSDERGEWGESFAWLANYLDTFFDPTEQKDYYLAWLQRFYGSALAGHLERGQNVFLVGGVDVGKSLMGHRIIGALLGGCADASDHLVRQSEFNKALGESAVWLLDDSQVAADPVAHRKFAELVKKLASTPTINFRKMYADAETQEWAGRLFCCLNDDSYSLQMIPDLSISLEDKVLIFKAADVARKFPPRHELEPMIAQELPHFARWLIEWQPPEHVLITNRFGVRKYIHEGLRTAALHSGQVGDFLELVAMFIKTVPPEDEVWEGMSSDFYSQVGRIDELRPLITKYSPRVIGRFFRESCRIRESGVEVVKEDQKRGNVWRIAIPEREPRTVRVRPEIEEVAA